MTRGTERLTANEASGCEPSPAEYSVAIDRLGGIVRARWHEATGASKIWRNKELIASHQREREAHAQPQFSGPVEDGAPEGFGNRLQGQ